MRNTPMVYQFLMIRVRCHSYRGSLRSEPAFAERRRLRRLRYPSSSIAAESAVPKRQQWRRPFAALLPYEEAPTFMIDVHASNIRLSLHSNQIAPLLTLLNLSSCAEPCAEAFADVRGFVSTNYGAGDTTMIWKMPSWKTKSARVAGDNHSGYEGQSQSQSHLNLNLNLSLSLNLRLRQKKKKKTEKKKKR